MASVAMKISPPFQVVGENQSSFVPGFAEIGIDGRPPIVRLLEALIKLYVGLPCLSVLDENYASISPLGVAVTCAEALPPGSSRAPPVIAANRNAARAVPLRAYGLPAGRSRSLVGSNLSPVRASPGKRNMSNPHEPTVPEIILSIEWHSPYSLVYSYRAMVTHC